MRYAKSLVLFACFCASADEGMWTFDNPPVKMLQDKYHFTPTKEWLDHVRLSCARLNDGGSGSFVSPHGLLLTNHHVARGQLQKNSTPRHDYLRDGFLATTPGEEMKSPDLEVNVLISMENVTARVLEAVSKAGSPDKEFAARRAIVAQIERESQQRTGLRSDVVTLYQGGEYWVYRYKLAHPPHILIGIRLVHRRTAVGAVDQSAANELRRRRWKERVWLPKCYTTGRVRFGEAQKPLSY